MKQILLAQLILLLITLAGCAQWNAVKVGVAATTEKAADESLQVILWQFCKAASIGSIERWVDGDQELADARMTVCGKDKQANVVNTDD